MPSSTTERPGPFRGAFTGTRVLVTGHSGFKGSWLCEWLLTLGAEVSGFSLPPETSPSLFEQLQLAGRIDSRFGDVRDAEVVRRLIQETQPDFVFHLAAQPLVRRSYREPLLTWQANVMGTLHVLEALRDFTKPCSVVCVTTDKCYENREWIHGYREEDAVGGFDPYSSSKAAAEIAIAAWRRSFLAQSPVQVASARAGNVIGGGDWAEDRIVPDCVRALLRGEPIRVRNPHATRPWQHVLEPLSGYLWLAARLAQPDLAQPDPSRSILASAFNFGPGHDGNRNVRELVEEILRHAPGTWIDASDPRAVHEASLLQLSTDKAAALLRWSPVWRFPETIRNTVHWYQAVAKSPDPGTPAQLTRDQIAAYTQRAGELGLPWAADPQHGTPH